MKKNSNRKAGIFNPRNLLGVFLCLSGVSLAMLRFSFAAPPPTGTLTDVSPSLTYTAGPFTTSNPSPITQVDSGPRCDAQFPFDFLYLAMTLHAGYHPAHPDPFVRFSSS